MKNIALTLTFTFILLGSVSAAAALSLDEAKSQGLVGEMQTGYLGVVKPNPEAQALAQQINAQRKAKYAEIAQKNGTTVAAVEALAGKKAVQETASGRYVQSPSGEWVRK